jgi:hypothetical protein
MGKLIILFMCFLDVWGFAGMGLIIASTFPISGCQLELSRAVDAGCDFALAKPFRRNDPLRAIAAHAPGAPSQT